MDKVKDTIFKFLHLDNLVGSLSGYLESRLELFKMEIREDLGKALSKVLVFAVLGFFAFSFLIFFSIGVAQFINFFFTEPYAGYWIVAGVYGLAFVIVIIFKKEIDSSVEKRFIEMTKRKVK